MILKVTKYRTLTGVKKIFELKKEEDYKFIIRQDNEPKYLVDCFDFEHESNQIFNGLLISRRKSISKILSKVNKEQNKNLRTEKVILTGIKISSTVKEIPLEPFPLEWLK